MSLPRNVYKIKGQDKWVVKKSINGKTKYFKRFDSVEDAVLFRNHMERIGWVYDVDSDDEEKRIRDYFVRVSRDYSKKWYRVRHTRYGIIGRFKSLEKALFYRDLYSLSDLPREKIPKPSEVDLVTDNPYMAGLEYSVPERLVLDDTPSKRGLGKIVKKSVSCYSIYFGAKHFCTCRTYEQAYYVRRELVKCGWDENELTRIFDEYPRFYTWLLQFYIYICKDSHNKDYWLLTIPKDKSDDGKLQHITYSRLEDALFERDFLLEHGWDYDLLVECIDDNLNPYYNMELPPYPERKIKNISPRKSRDKEFTRMFEIIQENPSITVRELAERVGVVDATLRNWFKLYNTTSKEFYKLCHEGVNPSTVLVQEELIYTPDLSKSKCGNYKGYVHYNPKRKSPFIVNYRDEYFGCYPTRELADKIVKELIKVDWDKSQLKRIRDKFNCRSRLTNEFMYISPTHKGTGSWRIRKKINGKNISFGVYDSKEWAMVARDILINRDFECTDLEKLRIFSRWIFYCKTIFYGNMFGGVVGEEFEV